MATNAQAGNPLWMSVGEVCEAAGPWIKSETVVALGGVLVALAAIVVAPWAANRQQHRQWLREHRTQLYAAIIEDALAREEWFGVRQGPLASDAPRYYEERDPELFVRARLLASNRIQKAAERFGRAAESPVSYSSSTNEVRQASERRVKAARLHLEAEIRIEMGTNA